MLIYAIGRGKIMIAEKGWHGDKPWAGPKAIRYQPQATASRLILVANSHLQKHPNVMTALQACSEEGKWTLVTERPENPGSRTVHFLDELPTVRQFLFQQRRIFRHSQDASVKFQKVWLFVFVMGLPLVDLCCWWRDPVCALLRLVA